jgi:TetR/AcrR family acrAB operon transcriptional repressor
MDDSLTLVENEDPLTQIENSLCLTIDDLNNNIEMRQTYEIMIIKCEYVEEFSTVLQQILNNCSSITGKIKLAYEHANNQNLLVGNHTPLALALDTHLFFSGLLHMWIKDADGSMFRHQAKELIKSHIDLRRKP